MPSWMKDSLGDQLLGAVAGIEYIASELYVGINTIVGTNNQEDYLIGEPDSPYIRQECAFDQITGGITNIDPIGWYDLPGVDINSIFVSDSPSTGLATVLFIVDLETPYTVASGSGIIIDAGALLISFTNEYLIGEGYV